MSNLDRIRQLEAEAITSEQWAKVAWMWENAPLPFGYGRLREPEAAFARRMEARAKAFFQQAKELQS